MRRRLPVRVTAPPPAPAEAAPADGPVDARFPAPAHGIDPEASR
ncbi:hypothetical protein [Planomonospora sp. ID82291]|nr:hypothetical protein [Planomonospora sp. ID82291]